MEVCDGTNVGCRAERVVDDKLIRTLTHATYQACLIIDSLLAATALQAIAIEDGNTYVAVPSDKERYRRVKETVWLNVIRFTDDLQRRSARTSPD
jgi:hypothetical protein